MTEPMFPEQPDIDGARTVEPGVGTIEFQVPATTSWRILSVSNEDGEAYLYVEFAFPNSKFGVFLDKDAIPIFTNSINVVGGMVLEAAEGAGAPEGTEG